MNFTALGIDMQPDVSIIITSYNVEHYIKRAVDSALSQQGIRLEIIIADDNSTDNTWNVITTFDDPRIQSLRLPENMGPGASRNAAIARASGKWLAVLDGDDAFLPDRLKRCTGKAEDAKADIVVDNLNIFREADGAVYPMFPPAAFSKLGALDLALLIKGKLSPFSPYTLGYLKPLFSAGFLRKHSLSYPADIRIGEDYIFLARALACGAKCAVEPSEGYSYTVRKGSISHRLTASDITRMREADRKYLSTYAFSPQAVHAQCKRDTLLQREYAFALLVDAIKQKSLSGIFSAAAIDPACLFLLRRPLWARIRKLFKPMTGKI